MFPVCWDFAGPRLLLDVTIEKACCPTLHKWVSVLCLARAYVLDVPDSFTSQTRTSPMEMWALATNFSSFPRSFLERFGVATIRMSLNKKITAFFTTLTRMIWAPNHNDWETTFCLSLTFQTFLLERTFWLGSSTYKATGAISQNTNARSNNGRPRHLPPQFFVECP